MGRSPPLPHHPQRRRQRGTAGAQYAGRSGLINIKRDDALLHYLTGHYPGNTPPATDSTEAESEWRWQEAVKGRDFWLMVAGDTGTTLGVQTAWIALILARGDGWVMALAGLVQAGASVVGMLIGGLIGDRVAIRNAVFGFSSARALGVVLSLAWAVVSDGDAVVFASAILIGIGSGGLAPLGFAMRGAYFGRRNFGAINGLSLFVYTVAVSAGHFGAAALMTLEGTKIPALVTPAIFAVVGAGLFLLLGNPRPSPSQRAATTAVAD
jgi:MFS family permease